MTRFRIEDAHEILKDPGGHAHHWTILEGVLEEGALQIGNAMAIPRIGGGSWLAQIIGFERFRENMGDTVDAASEVGRVLGVAVWGVAPPRGTVARGEARVVGMAEARELASKLRALEPDACDHCADCRRVSRFEQEAAL
jgi:hypothetical protein